MAAASKEEEEVAAAAAVFANALALLARHFFGAMGRGGLRPSIETAAVGGFGGAAAEAAVGAEGGCFTAPYRSSSGGL